jgi:ubiquinone/menaquinone biosynthesis C-methylase UbiE
MRTDYDTISEEYKRSKQMPWRAHVEHFTLFEILGDLKDKDVLDLACGEGFYARFIKRAGAARVVGVDISAGMIDLARQEEARQPLGIEYVLQDAKQADFGASFDLVVAAYLLNYASSKEELLEMCRSVARNLKPGCRFVTVNANAELSPEFNETSRKYGLIRVTPPELREGTPYQWRNFQDDRSFDITNYYLSAATHDGALHTAGFTDIRWHAPRLSPAAEAEQGKEFWREFLEHPRIVFIECKR